MDTNKKSFVVTVEEYFAILKKDGVLSPKEISQKNIFEKFMAECEKMSDTLSPACQDICTEYRKEIAKLYYRRELTPLESEVLTHYESQKSTKEDLGYTRVFSKSGYVDAVVVLVLLMNVGFIIAMILLGNK